MSGEGDWDDSELKGNRGVEGGPWAVEAVPVQEPQPVSAGPPPTRTHTQLPTPKCVQGAPPPPTPTPFLRRCHSRAWVRGWEACPKGVVCGGAPGVQPVGSHEPPTVGSRGRPISERGNPVSGCSRGMGPAIQQRERAQTEITREGVAGQGCIGRGEGGYPPPRVTVRRVVVPLRGPGQSPVLPFARCVGSLRSDGRCGRCSCWCRFRVRGA